MAERWPAWLSPINSQFFPADGGGADGVFDQVVVDLDSAIPKIDFEQSRVGQSIVDGSAHGRTRQEPASHLPPQESAADTIYDRLALGNSEISSKAASL